MSKAFPNEAGNDFLGPPRVHNARSKIVPTSDVLVAGDGAENDRFGITWFEPDRCTCGDVESLSVGPGAIEGQTRVSFDEMIVRSDL